MMAVFHSLEICPHAARTPACVASKRCNAIPIRIAGVEQDHCVVGCATAQGACARVENPIHSLAAPCFAIVRIAFLLLLVAVMTHKEVPSHGFVLRCERMKTRYIVVRR